MGDICGLELQPDNITSTCSISYRGDLAPTLSWTQDNINDVTQYVTNKLIHNSAVISTLVVSANRQMNGSWFKCSVGITYQLKDLVEQNISWTSTRIQLLCMYLLFTVFVFCILYVS